MYISKTDYLEYTFCKKNLWLKKHKPELFKDVELSDFEKKIIDEGNLADVAARNLFPNGQLVEAVGIKAVLMTENLLTTNPAVIFQGAFLSDEFFVQADILKFNEILKGFELYEVKATNDVKREVPNHHINDLAFQKTVIEKTGLKIVKAGVIHLNNEYYLNGTSDDINFDELFIVADLTDEVLSAETEVREQMNEMKSYLHEKEEKGCSCLYRGRNNHCTTFSYSNPEVPEYSVHDMNRIGGSKRLFYDWIDRGIYSFDDIDNPEKLTGTKKAQYDSYMIGRPLINNQAIEEELSELVFPIHFFDYEGHSSAIPRFNGFTSYEQTPFQYSLHILHEDGRLEHREFLITEPTKDLTLPLIEQMEKDFYAKGSVISWYKSYEAQRNNKLAELHPDRAVFLNDLNDRTYDLRDVFLKNYYVDSKFKGSSSIKNVLPVLVPTLTYKNLNIKKGDQAVERWEKLINSTTSTEEKEQIAKDLLEYCKLDTLAMVEIYRFLKRL